MQQQESSYESTFLVNPGVDNEGWDKTVYFKICNLTPKSGTLLKVCFTLIEMESSGVDLGMFISKRKKTVSSQRKSFLFSVYQLEIWLEIYATARYVLRCGDLCKILLEEKGLRTVSEWKLNSEGFNFRFYSENVRMWQKLRIQHIWIWLAPLISPYETIVLCFKEMRDEFLQTDEVW